MCSLSHLSIWMYVIQRSSKAVHVSFMSYIYVHVCLNVLWRSSKDEDESFCYHSWRNNVVIAFGTLSSFLSSKRNYYIITTSLLHHFSQTQTKTREFSRLAFLSSSNIHWSKEGGAVLFWGGFQMKNLEEEEPPQKMILKNRLKIDQFWGWFFRGGPVPSGFLIREHNK